MQTQFHRNNSAVAKPPNIIKLLPRKTCHTLIRTSSSEGIPNQNTLTNSVVRVAMNAEEIRFSVANSQ